MSTRIDEAIKSRWDAQNLDATFAGGFWRDEAASHTAFPYVVLTSIANVPTEWSSDAEHREQSYQFAIFYKGDGTNDPVSLGGTHARALKAAFDFAPLSIPTSSGQFVVMRPGPDRVFKDPDKDDVWQAQVDYSVRRTVNVNYA